MFKIGKILSIILVLGLTAVLTPPTTQAAGKKFITIGTGGIGGGYYPAGGFVCNIINKTREKYGHNIHCSVESTAGSVGNLRSLRAGDIDVGFSQADWQFHAFNGSSKFKKVGPNPKIRFLFSLQIEPMHLVTRKAANIKNFKDLKGKIVNTGNVGSGTEATIYEAISQYNTTAKELFKQDTKLTPREQALSLCDGKIDAFFFPVAIGTASIVEATNSCDAQLADWNDETIYKWVDKIPYLSRMEIPKGSYPGQERTVKSWGMPATVVTTSDLDEKDAYLLTKAVFDEFEKFKKQSALFVGMTREGSAKNGQSAPYHPGALKYYKEVGLVK
ncbi:TAXI family TRAP transporter solute-binding subunit [Dethiosulfatarculus sandiegensis]|uniref:C4-dicarboxylate ABC transporter substrate-binding protein n=1 Tax=Dethiosulfatarculus sandiegensis TaxID=1429043 RepID=A0A0D2HXT1_9BACT|nr:TAXI family TRAP transporter solute-binding subunit [Dethiosulfatarculus sandiegensis]KIX15108.1 C4-dicarboxylate ABC transporter substrate-binding protein [Dethiosulfatarculus sandiegensis]